MALFKTEPADARMRAEITIMHTRKADLVSQVEQSKATESSLTTELHDAHMSGNASSSDIEKIEARLANVTRRIASLNSAINAFDGKIANAEADLSEYEASEAANRAAIALDADHAEFAIKLAALVVAAEALLPVATKVGERVTSGKEIEALARAIVAQLPPAARRIEDETRWTRELIVRERPSRLVNAA